MILAKVIADSIGVDAPRLTTLELVYPRFIHAELMTHRVFSRNASSSRAIPVKKLIADLRATPALPVEWRMDESGMQGFTAANETQAREAEAIYIAAMEDAIRHAERLDAAGFHKQHVNRLLEPFAHIKVVLTATQWRNWDGLRDHPDADPTICALAKAIIAARDASTPQTLLMGNWHLPYIEEEDAEPVALFLKSADRQELGLHSDDHLAAVDLLKRVSAARCARTSYKTFDGKRSTVPADLKLFNKLVTSDLIHASPTEHQAAPDAWLTKGKRWMSPHRHGNLKGWCQFRKFLANENLDDLPVAA